MATPSPYENSPSPDPPAGLPPPSRRYRHGAWALIVLALGGAWWVMGASGLRGLRLCTDIMVASGNVDAVPLLAMHARARHQLTYSRFQPEQREALRFILYGDPDTTKDTATRQRAIWERDRTRKEWYANYLYHLARDAHAQPRLEAALREGIRRDPANALYRYWLAERLFSQAISGDPAKPGTDAAGRTTFAHWSVTDRAKLEQGIALLRSARACPEYHGYHLRILQERLRHLPPPRGVEDQAQRLTLTMAVIFPEYARLRGLACYVPFVALTLYREGRAREADLLLESWRPLVRHMAQEPDTLIHVLVMRAIVRVYAKHGAAAYRLAGRAAQAERLRVDTARLETFYQAWYQPASTNPRTRESYLKRHGSMLAALLLPVMHPRDIRAAELAPGRLLEYVKIEQVGLIGLLALLTSLLVFTLLIGYGRRLELSRAQQLLPPLLGLTARGWGQVALALILPLAFWIAYTRVTDLAWGDRQLAQSPATFLLPLCLLGALLLVLPAWVAARDLHRQWRAHGVPAPGGSRAAAFGRGVLTCVWVGIFMQTGLLCPLLVGWWVWGLGIEYGIVAGIALIACSVQCGLTLLPVIYGRAHPGTAYRSLAPVYAVVILCLVVIVHPALRAHEGSLLRQERLLFYAEGVSLAGMTPAESRTCRYLADGFLRSLEEASTSTAMSE